MTTSVARKMEPHKPLEGDELAARLEDAPEWSHSGNAIHREFEFRDFREAIQFVNAVADAADKADHHPDIFISYNKVEITLTTHSAGGVTAKDFDLARDIDFI